jgi:hypothetical protein
MGMSKVSNGVTINESYSSLYFERIMYMDNYKKTPEEERAGTNAAIARTLVIRQNSIRSLLKELRSCTALDRKEIRTLIKEQIALIREEQTIIQTTVL